MTNFTAFFLWPAFFYMQSNFIIVILIIDNLVDFWDDFHSDCSWSKYQAKMAEGRKIINTLHTLDLPYLFSRTQDTGNSTLREHTRSPVYCSWNLNHQQPFHLVLIHLSDQVPSYATLRFKPFSVFFCDHHGGA